jgi:flagellar basal body-associated protein FliL
MDSQPQPNYDFILNSQKQNGRGAMSSRKQRIIFVLVTVIVVLVTTIIIGNVVSSASNKTNNQVLDLVAYQAELKRVIGLGNERARSSATKNKALTASLTLESDYKKTVTIINSRKVKIPKDLFVKYSGTQTDQTLDVAEKSNAFDSTYEELYTEKLTNYRAKLVEIYPSLKPAEQAVIKKQSDNVKLLLGEPLTSEQQNQ